MDFAEKKKHFSSLPLEEFRTVKLAPQQSRAYAGECKPHFLSGLESGFSRPVFVPKATGTFLRLSMKLRSDRLKPGLHTIAARLALTYYAAANLSAASARGSGPELAESCPAFS